MKDYNNFIELPIQEKSVKTCWLAFPILVKKNKFFTRKDLQIFLENNNIQTRVIFSGNVLKQPLMKKIKYIKTKDCEIQSNKIMQNGILIGCHHGMTNRDIDFIVKKIKLFINLKTKRNLN